MLWQDLHVHSDGTARLIIHRSKTDQTGEGAVIAVTKRAMDDLLRWYETQDPPDTARVVFDICKRQISRIVDRRAAARRARGGYSGHSGRVGLALTMDPQSAAVRCRAASGSLEDHPHDRPLHAQRERR